MPKPLLFVMLIEIALVLLTTLLLIQPKGIFRAISGRTQTIAHWGGMFLLGLTFCWSIVFGVILSMNEITFRL